MLRTKIFYFPRLQICKEYDLPSANASRVTSMDRPLIVTMNKLPAEVFITGSPQEVLGLSGGTTPAEVVH